MTPDLASVAYGGPDDLLRMQGALSRSWQLRRPFVNTTVGDLEWWLASAQPGTDWTDRIRLWPDPADPGGPVLGYGWFNPPDELDWHQRAGLAPGVRAALVDEALAWAASAARTGAAAGGLDAPERLTAWAMDGDAELGALLRERGFEPRAEATYTHFYRRLDGAPPPEPVLPPGYRIRHVRLPDDLPARVEVHRAAFAPSRMTIEKYEGLTRMRHYAPERDLVVEAPDGSFAAFTLAWLDRVAGLGEFEPVGTHPDHRRLGLARAVNLAGLRVLRDEGARDCLVLSARSNAASEALYASAGFEAVSGHRAWSKPLAAAG
ncbi:MAG TPA: GNAT family N-acetyltransferase [Candidatus Limnocylindrales bacterium]|nr:GNAT family N-acetyltransferase [Candidatus Limnocylindrales bacterium]